MRDLAALPRLGGKHDRLPHIVHPTPVTKVAAGQAAIPERAGRPGQAELLGQRERLLGVVDPGLVAALQRLGALRAR